MFQNYLQILIQSQIDRCREHTTYTQKNLLNYRSNPTPHEVALPLHWHGRLGVEIRRQRWKLAPTGGYVALWHNPDLQRPLGLGPIMAALPTFGAECLVIAAFQTWRRGVAKVGT